MSALLCMAAACTEAKDQPAEGEAKPEATKTEAPAEKTAEELEAEKAAEEAAKEAEERKKRVAEAMEKAKKEAAEEAARWTDEMRKAATELVEASHKNAKAALSAVLGSEHRTPGNADRDAHRHPVKTLLFFGLKPDMTVLEVGAGGGWYTELLAPVLAKDGMLYVAGYDPKGPDDSFRTYYGARFQMFLDKSPELFGKVKVNYIDPPEKLTLAPAGSVDLAIAAREMHGWHRRDAFDAYVKAVFEALKPGGVFGVVQHRAPAGANPDESAEKGYLPEEWVIKSVEAQGFKLVEKSEINANDKDTKDYEKGVWTLPPAFAEEDKDKAKYEAIGESDRMTLKFMKPEA